MGAEFLYIEPVKGLDEKFKEETIEKLLEYEKNLKSKISEYEKIAKEYIEKMNIFEAKKLEVIDPTKRDSVEKQLMNAMQHDKELQQLFLNVEKLRREKDLINKEIDSIKIMISLNQTILNLD
jgi:hypothetical protein